MRERGKVVKIIKDNKAEIEMSAAGGCAKCGLCKIGLNNKAYLTAKYDINITEGDHVEVEIKGREFIFLAFLLFILPLLLFFLGYLIYDYVLGMILFIASFVGIWLYDKDSQNKGKYLPIIVRKI